MTTIYLEIKKVRPKLKLHQRDFSVIGHACADIFNFRFPGVLLDKIKQREYKRKIEFSVLCYPDTFSQTIQEVIDLYINPNITNESFDKEFQITFGLKKREDFPVEPKKEFVEPMLDPFAAEPKRKRPRIKK